MNPDAQAVLQFWFNELTPAQWFKKDLEMDRIIVTRFAELYARVAQCECYSWRETSHGRLAEIIVLDQFSRNMYRDNARAFGYDALALALAQEAVAAGADDELSPQSAAFYICRICTASPRQFTRWRLACLTSQGLKTTWILKFAIR